MRYVVRKQVKQVGDELDWLMEQPFVPDLTVYEDSDGIVPTGLVDLEGNAICRYEKGPLGFLAEEFEDLE